MKIKYNNRVIAAWDCLKQVFFVLVLIN